MGRGGKVVGQRNFKKRVRSNGEGSDDSDEDYVIEDEEHGSGDESVEYASSLEGCCEDEEDEERMKGSWRVVQSKIGRKTPRKRRKASYEEDEDYYKVEDDDIDDEDYVKFEDDDDNDDEDYSVKVRARRKINGCLKNWNGGGKSSRRKRKVSYEEEEDYVKDEDDDDEDFVVTVQANRRIKGCVTNGKTGGKSLRKRREVSYQEDKDYVKVEDDDDNDDKDDDFVIGANKRIKGCLENGKIEGKSSRKRRNMSYEEDEDYVNVEDDGAGSQDNVKVEDDDAGSQDNVKVEDDDVGRQDNVKVEDDENNEEDEAEVQDDKRSNGCLENGKISEKRRKDSYEEDEDKDEDYVNIDDEEEEDDDDYDGEDEEMALCEEEGEDDCLDEEEEEEVVTRKKSNNVKMARKTRSNGRGVGSKRKMRKSGVAEKSVAKKKRNRGRLRKKANSDYEDDDEDENLVDCNLAPARKSKKPSGSGRRKCTVNSDSDFVVSGSECDYTISEEEREQVRESKRLSGGLKTSLRSSSSLKATEEEDNNQDFPPVQEKPVAKKGKEKVKDLKPEAAKQVCGICFSEEDKRRLRGTLDCCSHYFCFKCIMEWSKVESRCPLCKQRFTAITKNGRLSVGVDLRSQVIDVPKRDQVYQPTEEEIRSFIDPYEHVNCTECHEGGDDALMLLCDICDSPAHTYCVGLGRQVPDGHWYCDGCKPVALGSSSSQGQEHILSDQRPTINRFTIPVPVISNRFIRQMPVSDTFDRSPSVSNLEDRLHTIPESSPHLAFPQAFRSPMASQRFPMGGDLQAASFPASGTGASTLWGRREIHRHIHSLLSSRMNSDGIQATSIHRGFPDSRNSMAQDTGMLGLGSAYSQRGEMLARSSMTQNTGMLGLGNALIEGRSQISNGNPSPLVDNSGFFGFEPSQWRPAHMDSSTIAIERPVSLTLWPQDTGINLVPGYGRDDRYNNRPSINQLGSGFPPYGVNNGQLYILKEQLQALVTADLKALSHDIELGQDNINQIVKASTHTILAHCGLEHESHEVVPLPPPSRCTHVDRIAPGQASMMRGLCWPCFESFVSDVVKKILDSRVTRLPQWLSLGL